MLNKISKACNDKSMTAYEAWARRKPNFQHVRVFESEAYMYVPKQFMTKFDARSNRVLVVGYQGESANYWLYDPIRRKVDVSRNVVIREKYDSTGDEDDDWDVTLPCSIQEQQDNTMRDSREESESVRPRQLRDRTTLKQPQWYEQQNTAFRTIIRTP